MRLFDPSPPKRAGTLDRPGLWNESTVRADECGLSRHCAPRSAVILLRFGPAPALQSRGMAMPQAAGAGRPNLGPCPGAGNRRATFPFYATQRPSDPMGLGRQLRSPELPAETIVLARNRERPHADHHLNISPSPGSPLFRMRRSSLGRHRIGRLRGSGTSAPECGRRPHPRLRGLPGALPSLPRALERAGLKPPRGTHHSISPRNLLGRSRRRLARRRGSSMRRKPKQ